MKSKTKSAVLPTSLMSFFCWGSSRGFYQKIANDQKCDNDDRKIADDLKCNHSDGYIANDEGPKNSILAQKRAILGNRC